MFICKTCNQSFDTEDELKSHQNYRSADEKLIVLEERIKSLEADRDRFMNAFREAAGMAIKNPMVAAMIPKEMKEGIKKFTEEKGN